MNAAMEIAGDSQRDGLLDFIDGVLYYREGAAKRFPHDMRNQEGIDQLKDLRKHVEAMPSDAPIFRLMALEHDSDHAFSARLSDWLGRRLTRMGSEFDSTPSMFLGDLREFVTAKGE